MTGTIFVSNAVHFHTVASTFQVHFVIAKNRSRHPGLVESNNSYVYCQLPLIMPPKFAFVFANHKRSYLRPNLGSERERERASLDFERNPRAFVFTF